MTTTSVGLDPHADPRPSEETKRLRSMRGAVGALMLLLALPITIAVEMVLPGSNETTIHVMLAVGTLLIGLSASDFATVRWQTLAARAAAIVLAAIFLAQGLGVASQNESLRNFAFSREVGGWGEDVTLTIVMLWFIAVALTLGRGLTMWLGIVSAAVVAGLSTWALLAGPATGTPDALRLMFLLPIAWFLFVSTRPSRLGPR